MSRPCKICGGLIMASNEVMGYGGPICNGLHATDLSNPTHTENSVVNHLVKNTINPDPRVSKTISDHFWDEEASNPTEPEVYHCDIGHSRSYKFKKDYDNHMKNMHGEAPTEPITPDRLRELDNPMAAAHLEAIERSEAPKSDWEGATSVRIYKSPDSLVNATSTPELELEADNIIKNIWPYGKPYPNSVVLSRGIDERIFQMPMALLVRSIQNLIHQAAITELSNIHSGANSKAMETGCSARYLTFDDVMGYVADRINELKEII